MIKWVDKGGGTFVPWLWPLPLAPTNFFSPPVVGTAVLHPLLLISLREFELFGSAHRQGSFSSFGDGRGKRKGAIAAREREEEGRD